MLTFIWMLLVLGAMVIGFCEGTTSAVATAVTSSATEAVTIAIGLIGIMAFWLGLMRVAEDAGLIKSLARVMSPLLSKLFPDVPRDHPAMGAMILNIAANMLGLGNAATPFGLRAMEQLEKLNPFPGTATNAMCTFLAINTSSVQIVPATAIAILAANGDKDPTSILFPALLATTCSTVAAIITVKMLQRLPCFKIKGKKQ